MLEHLIQPFRTSCFSKSSRIVGSLLILVQALLPTTGCDSGGSEGWYQQGNAIVHFFDFDIRIGDDIDYNEQHPDQFVIDSAVSEYYYATFNLPNFNYSQAVILGEIAGSSQADKLYINDMLVGILPKGDNSAFTRKPISFDVTSFLIPGVNSLLISLEKWPGDKVTPLDDIEIFGLRIELYP